MRLKQNRLFALIIFACLSFITLRSQTLYWVGGSGNFNDPKHWSLSSGGAPANIIPNSLTDVVFDDNSGKGYFIVSLSGNTQTKSFSTPLYSKAVKFTGSVGSFLNIGGSFSLSRNTKFETQSELIFESSGIGPNIIDFGSRSLNNNVKFKSGIYNFNSLQVSDSKTIYFGSGRYNFNSIIVSAGNIINEDNSAYFNLKNTYLILAGKVKISNAASVNAENVMISGDVNSQSNFSVPNSLLTSKGYTSVNTINAFCPVSISFSPACGGPCTGILTVSLSPSCTTTPYSVQAFNLACPSLTAALSNTNIPSVFTVTNACACGTGNFAIQVRDGSNTVQTTTTGINFSPNPAFLFPSDTQPSCSYSCDGILQGTIFGSPPFNVSVVSSGTNTIPSFTTATGDYSLTGACAATYTFNVTDVNGCFTSIVTTLSAPAVLLANAVTSSIVCNGFNTGSLSITPTGGTANYTVNFSNSNTFTTSGSIVSATGLGVGLISATVTDSQGCTTIASGNVTQPTPPLTTVFSQTNLACNNVCNGVASSTASGGTPPYTYVWSGVGSGSFVTGLCAGTKTLNISDFNGCTTSTQIFTITQPPAITLTPTFTNVVCSGSCTGAASISPSGGTGLISFTWVAPGPSTISVGAANSISNLCAGSYTVFSRDVNLCSHPPVIINITQPPAATLAIVTKSVSCFGLADGGATVTASGGNGAPYTYSWTPGPLTTSVISGLVAGNYNLIVFDSQSCTIPGNATIIQPSLVVTPAVTFTNLTCHAINSPCDGIINESPVGGTPPYSYTLTNGVTTLTTPPPYNSLCAGNYTAIVQDVSGCPQQSVVTLTQPGALLPTIATTSVNCFGFNTGGLTGSPSAGGTPTYALTWATPTGTASGAILTNQPAGNYTFFVVDSKSCTAQATATVAQASIINIAVGTSSISCFSVCNGVLTSTVSGGTGLYIYSWTNSLSIEVGTAPTATALCPGPYTLTITDANLCIRTSTGVVLSPTPIVLTPTTIPVNCFGDSNGSATVTATGGTPSYTYNFVSASAIITNFSGIILAQPAGSVLATITDAAGCTATTTFAIASPTALAAAISGTGSCNVCNGTATITPSFGTAPYSYLWTSSLSGTFATTPTVGGLCPANYTATVTDSKGCVISRTISIIQIISISINPGAASILCNGATTGSATTSPTGGTPGYTYLWTPTSQTTQVISGVGAGTYVVQVTDSSVPACSHTAAITLTQPPAISVTATQTNVTCFSFTNGAITTSVSGGTPGFPVPYSYTWSPGGQNTSSITGIGTGVYTLNLRDGNLCPAVATVSVTQPSSITIGLSVTNPAGCVPALANGSIVANPTGGSGAGYSYTLTPIGTTNTTGSFTGLGGGAYSIIVRDGVGCSNTTVTTLSNPSGPTITAVSSSVACNGFSTAIASATATGLTPAFTFSWTPSTVTFTSTSTTSSANNLPAGVYFVTATDGNSCVATQSVGVAQAQAYTVNPIVSNLRCNNVSTGSIVVAPAGGSPAYTYTWSPAGVTGQNTGTITNLAAGVYTLSLNDIYNCISPYTFTVTQPPAITLTAITSSVLCFGACTGSIVADANGGTGSINYSWTPVGASSATVINLCANTGTNPGAYTLVATDQNTCAVTNTYIIAEPPQLTGTVTILNASCSNSCNAIATVSVSGGVPVYNYSWSSSTVTTSSLGSLCPATTHTSTITDANGCILNKAFITPSVTPLSVTLTPSNPLCNAACNGSIATTVSGAQGAMNYVWSPAGSGQNPTGLCAVPNPIYTLVATDQNSCQVTSVVTLTNPPALLASVNEINPLCNGDANGTATVSFVNAVGATSYTWLPTGPPTQTTQVATGLSAGSFTVIVKDANQCQASQTFTLTNPSTITINTSINPSSCSFSNGAITANPSGGTPGSPTPYTYTWTGALSSSSVVSGIPAGIYTVQVADGLGCTNSAIITLSDANGPNVMPVSSTSLNCNAQCIGTASVDIGGIQGGTAPYTAMWIAPAPSTLNPLSGLCAGIYTAQVSDAVGCIGFTNVTIAEPPPIDNNPSVGLPLCPGICDGTISLNTTGGNSPYTYTWVSIPSNSTTLTNLCAGDYTIVVGYNTTCLDTSIISIPDQSSITILPTVTNNTCFGTCNGIVSLSVTGGTSPYNMSWSNSQTGPLITGLCNNTYSVSVTDFNGCNNTATASITSGAQITSTTSVISPSCGLCDGTATVSATGTGPFTFNWSNSATTPTVSSLCAGVYQVIISDALACTQTETIIINNSNGITGENINTQQIPCSGSCVGAATVTAIGGNAPITYNWLNPAVSNSVISNLCPGTYFVQMSDAQNCIRIASVSINPLVTMTVSPFVQLPACGSSNGSISLVIAGGTPSYTIVWNPPAGNTTSITGINSGVYSYTVTESSTNSCSLSQAINMSNSNGPVLTFEQKNIDCFGVCSGSLSVVATSTSAPINYLWSNGSTSQTLTNLCSGVITLTVTDAGLCRTIRSFTITDSPLLQLGLSNIQNPSCFGDCDGAITLVPSGGSLPYTYSWTTAGASINPIGSLCDGIYSANVTDAKGCLVSTPSFTIRSLSAMSIIANSFNSSCSSVADGTITLNVSGGVTSYSYAWNGSSGYTATTQNVLNISSGIYTVNVLDNLGCRKDTVLQVVPSITVVAKAGNDQIICPVTGSVLLSAGTSSGSAGYRWFSFDDKLRVNALSSGSTLLVKDLAEASRYILVATATVASCSSEDTVGVNLYSLPAVDAGRDYTVPVYTSVTLGGQPSTWGAVTLTWSPSVYLNDAGITNPIASNTVNVTYTLSVTDSNGCTESDTVRVFLFPELNITSGFTPNGDGKNDFWIIDYIDQFPANTVDIFNRWGDVIFSSTGYQTPFDGKYKGTDLPVGTYYYVIKLNHPGYPKPITGPLTIFR